MKNAYSKIEKSIVEAIVIALIAMTMALLINLVRTNGIPFFATENYETMVPCPVQDGRVNAISAKLANIESKGIIFIDARERAEFRQWHKKDAMLLTYDFLDAVPEADIRKVAKKIAAARATKVIVYGDGSNPDTGKLLGIDISAAGIKNVFFVKGGATALQGIASAREGGSK